MMGFVKDGEANEAMLRDRDKRFDVSFEERRGNRDDIASPTVLPGANQWQSGRTVQLKLEEVQVRNLKDVSEPTEAEISAPPLTAGSALGGGFCTSCTVAEQRPAGA